MGLLEARMAQKRGKTAQLTYALKVSASIDPSVVEDNIPTYESSVPTPNQEDQIDGD